MWLAGAYEGFATSLLWCIDMRLAVEEAVGRDLRGLLQSGMSLSCAAIKLAEDRGVEALGLYARNITFAGLEVECSLKLARMYEEAATAGVPDREQKVMEFLLRAVSVPGLNRQQQMECTLEAAFICSRMRLHRKYAFFLFLAALFANDSENAVVTHFMMKCALQKYGINFKEDEVQAILHSSVDVSDNAGAHASFAHSAEQQLHAKEDGHTVGRGLSWASMRRVLYAQCAHFAREAGDSTSAARCMAGMLRLLAEADVQWRQSTANWLPRNFKPTDLKKLLLTCNNINLSALSAGVSPMGSSPDLSNQSASKSGIPLTINVRFASERSLPSSTDHLSPVNAKSPVNARSPVISSLNSSHSMAQFRNIYSKGNYQRLHAKMRNAGGRIADLQENLASMIEKNQVFEFSFNGNDEREMSDTLSEVGSVRGGFVPAFLSEGSLNKVSNLKRKVAVPKLDGFVASLTFRPSAASTPKLLPRSASIASVGGASNVGIAFDNHANDQASIHGSVGGGDGASVLNANYNASMGGSIFSLGNAVATPSNITSQLLGSPDIASAAMISAGLVDENGMPNVGALTPSSNCIIRSWLGSGGGGSSAGFEKLRPLQEGCIRRLEMFCEDVPPSCPIYLGESPLLISMTPQALPDNSRPFPTPRQKIVAGVLVKDDEKSALYYDPFMAKRDKRLKESSKKPEEIIWVQGMVSKVLVCFSNSLSAPIRMCNVAVILQEVEETSTGKCYEITPENIEIPSVIEGGASYQTVLSIMPIKVCKLKLIGMRYFIRNAVYISLIDENGFGMSKRFVKLFFTLLVCVIYFLYNFIV